VTAAQFRAFRSDHDFNRSFAQQDDAPANNVSWYDAAAFCNWLNEKENIPRDQWCYDPDQPIDDGMVLYADYLQRTGYRLATEAEWEFACRAGTATARSYGETDALLIEYGWYAKDGNIKPLLPVGSLKPNPAGLFDMLGNANEWCHDETRFYDTDVGLVVDSEQLDDVEQVMKMSNADPRAGRGGSIIQSPPFVRSSSRYSYQPNFRNYFVGFRVARTIR
jgi:formylglycine-generating enzyme required for sulfatase activity